MRGKNKGAQPTSPTRTEQPRATGTKDETGLVFYGSCVNSVSITQATAAIQAVL